ncbi:GTPase/DUF3482 domain-containing protein [Gynuella sunshinyii]|uniref:Putative GTPase n=1 Tax=Gynuella sunshinyii YC6258 TaxID=1445510 RepID=A0A0C5VAM1_9GAMM|nr:GTPase/DUF3482 domain-containing protein [Gynuella sunshinyii]AJQ96380.1 putative GTPase [Gynuella sunshinyii YC6258]
MIHPCFVVVGHPNKGKSSLVATLAQNDQIGISALSGTTLESTVYPMTVNDQLCYELVDTPGFQRAARLLEWLQQQPVTASQRQETILAWLQHDENETHFPDEYRLLTPLASEESAIIYVVDGSKPYRSSYEAEMEILRWTGRPRMAIINPISETDFIADWQQALDQYFSVVRVFNPVRASFTEQIDLLRVFSTLKQNWQDAIERAVAALQQQREEKLRDALEHLIVGMEEILTLKMKIPLPPQEQLADKGRQLVQTRYRHKVAELEQAVRKRILKSLHHYHFQDLSEPMLLQSSDLFDQRQWRLWGLPKQQLVWFAAGSGAAAGALVDIGLGGSSLLMGAAIGSVLSGGTVLLWGRDIAKAKLAGKIPMGYEEWSIGPVRNLSFAWALLSRYLYLIETLLHRNHSRRDRVEEDDQALIAGNFRQRVDQLNNKDKFKLNAWLQNGKRYFNSHEQLVSVLARLISVE